MKENGKKVLLGRRAKFIINIADGDFPFYLLVKRDCIFKLSEDFFFGRWRVIVLIRDR